MAKKKKEIVFGEWQQCPICIGQGRITASGYTSNVFEVCPTCDGQRIIARPII